MKGEKFSEVIVDHKTGKIAKTEPITSAARTSRRPRRKARRWRRPRARSMRPPLRPPGLKDGHPVADVTLVKGEEWKTVSEKLD